jgi:hypothetical protein
MVTYSEMPVTGRMEMEMEMEMGRYVAGYKSDGGQAAWR